MHDRLIGALPEQLRNEWQSIKGRGGKEAEILDSTRNRLKPYFDCPPLKQMFGGTESRLDVLRFMREGKIVLLNLAPYNQLPELNANAIGGMVINEIISTARSLPMGSKYPTFLMLDEFQNFVGPDIEAAIPEVRQLGLKMIFSHQSFAQLQRGDVDLSFIIFQCQSRCVFGVQGEDADLLATEFASIKFDPYIVKDVIYSRQQWLTGHKIIELQSTSFTQQQAEKWSKTIGHNWVNSQATARKIGSMDLGTRSDGQNRGGNDGQSQGGGSSTGQTVSTNQAVLPVHQEIEQLTKRVFLSFDEQRSLWAKDIRNASRGVAFIRLVDDPNIYHVAVERAAHGALARSEEQMRKYYPHVIERMEQLKEKNFALDYFVRPAEIERQTRERINRVLRPPMMLQTDRSGLGDVPKESSFT